MEKISERQWTTQQDVMFERVYVDGEHRMKLQYRANAYVFQSHCKVWRWTGEEWKPVAETPGELLIGYEPVRRTYHRQDSRFDPILIKQDVDALVKMAHEIVCPEMEESK